MKICIIGKYPPIQGGVSMRTYWHAHGLAALGHEVHVVTNAKEAFSPFRMYMRAEDWARCEASYGAGSVTVHWTDPSDRSQAYIPMASPFVTKLAGTAACVHASTGFDVVYSHYLEPYGVAGHLAAQIMGVPHVVRMAGSDAGRLWHHPQLEMLYDHVLKSAGAVVAVGTVAKRAVERGVAAERIAPGGHFAIPESLFTPDGPRLDLNALRNDAARDPDFRDLVWGELEPDRPHFGVYGKLGERKGSFSLLSALHRLKRSGRDAGLVVLAHGAPSVQERFRTQASELGLADRILQLPFIPHWRAEFLRGCLAVCGLEQDFPFGIHSPIIPPEVLMSGTCLVGSTEVIRKLPSHDRLPHGYGCIAIENVDDVEVLGARLGMIADNPETAAAIGRRGRKFASEWQQDVQFPRTLERILSSAAARQPVSTASRRPAGIQTPKGSEPVSAHRPCRYANGGCGIAGDLSQACGAARPGVGAPRAGGVERRCWPANKVANHGRSPSARIAHAGGGRGRQGPFNGTDRSAVSIAAEAGRFAGRRSGEPHSLDEPGPSYRRI